jgi:hypothetical protein
MTERPAGRSIPESFSLAAFGQADLDAVELVRPAAWKPSKSICM